MGLFKGELGICRQGKPSKYGISKEIAVLVMHGKSLVKVMEAEEVNRRKPILRSLEGRSFLCFCICWLLPGKWSRILVGSQA
ncbi:hypothetical protein MKW98_016340 [Papaver atlanticum]|uniref:Uncharacterized protein n=1 Tax=Papaver atlanticum TaxID=357466 RepID=A0AAD4XEY9_9MAGN|nr:hypothetical protein MKW98_016340 [Papaver atlanticum]